MKALIIRTILAVLVLGAATPFASAQKTIKIDFNSTAMFEESDGTKGTAKASGLTDAQKAKIIAKAQEKYDNALGKNKVMVMEGTGGDIDIIVSGDQAPGALKGKEYGDAGKPSKPGIVHAGEFTTDGFKDDGLTNAIGENLAHEAGHKLGLSHNWEKTGVMVEGSKLTKADREADNRSFTADDTKKLMATVCPPAPAKAEQKDTKLCTDLYTTVGEKTLPLGSNKPDDDDLDAYASFQGPADLEWGYMSYTNEFVYQGSTETPFDQTFISFLYDAGADLAVLDGSQLFSLSNGGGFFSLSNPNPLNPDVFRQADLYFTTNRGSAHLTLSATVDPTTGGFSACPEPASLALLATGIVPFLRRRRRLLG